MYRSNSDSFPRWDKDCRDGIHGWRTIIRVFKTEALGMQRREWRTTWISKRRLEMLNMYGYEEYGTGSGRPWVLDDELQEVIEDDGNQWISSSSTHGAPVVEP